MSPRLTVTIDERADNPGAEPANNRLARGVEAAVETLYVLGVVGTTFVVWVVPSVGGVGAGATVMVRG